MKYDISLCLAGIRPHFWKRLYESAIKSCTRYSWELVIISPFDLPEELKEFGNIKYIKEFGCPTRASQIGAANCEARLITFPSDDGFFLPDALDSSIDRHNACVNCKDGIVMRYKEGPGMNAPSFPMDYWNARYHIDVNHLNLGNDYKIAPQPLLSLEYYKEIGGFDCQIFECCSWATHDLCYRMQRDGSVFHLSPLENQDCDNHGTTGESHSPIYYAHFEDQRKFNEIYTNNKVKNRIKIDFDNWKELPDVWIRRWPNGRKENM